VGHYNNERLHSAVGYLTPRDALEGRGEAIGAERRRKLEAARLARARSRDAATARDLTSERATDIIPIAGETETGSAGEQPDRGISGRDFDAKSRALGGSNRLPSALPDIAEKLAHA
jgi:hypothetical protein